MEAMTHFEYITKHLFPTWVHQWTYNFKHWLDLITENYEAYENPFGESPERECYEWFWASINLDDTYTKEYLEELYQMVEDMKSNNVTAISLDSLLNEEEDPFFLDELP